jgi:hypothetical protein
MNFSGGGGGGSGGVSSGATSKVGGSEQETDSGSDMDTQKTAKQLKLAAARIRGGLGDVWFYRSVERVDEVVQQYALIAKDTIVLLNAANANATQAKDEADARSLALAATCSARLTITLKRVKAKGQSRTKAASHLRKTLVLIAHSLDEGERVRVPKNGTSVAGRRREQNKNIKSPQAAAESTKVPNSPMSSISSYIAGLGPPAASPSSARSYEADHMKQQPRSYEAELAQKRKQEGVVLEQQSPASLEASTMCKTQARRLAYTTLQLQHKDNQGATGEDEATRRANAVAKRKAALQLLKQPRQSPQVQTGRKSVAIALFDHVAQLEDELAFIEGERIDLIKTTGDWWKGSIGKLRRGAFPANYVKVVKEVVSVPSPAAALGGAQFEEPTIEPGQLQSPNQPMLAGNTDFVSLQSVIRGRNSRVAVPKQQQQEAGGGEEPKHEAHDKPQKATVSSLLDLLQKGKRFDGSAGSTRPISPLRQATNEGAFDLSLERRRRTFMASLEGSFVGVLTAPATGAGSSLVFSTGGGGSSLRESGATGCGGGDGSGSGSSGGGDGSGSGGEDGRGAKADALVEDLARSPKGGPTGGATPTGGAPSMGRATSMGALPETRGRGWSSFEPEPRGRADSLAARAQFAIDLLNAKKAAKEAEEKAKTQATVVKAKWEVGNAKVEAEKLAEAEKKARKEAEWTRISAEEVAQKESDTARINAETAVRAKKVAEEAELATKKGQESPKKKRGVFGLLAKRAKGTDRGGERVKAKGGSRVWKGKSKQEQMKEVALPTDREETEDEGAGNAARMHPLNGKKEGTEREATQPIVWDSVGEVKPADQLAANMHLVEPVAKVQRASAKPVVQSAAKTAAEEGTYEETEEVVAARELLEEGILTEEQFAGYVAKAKAKAKVQQRS